MWTNNPALVFPDSEINIENIAIFAHRSIYARVQVFLRYREYAFASDIVRLLILERYGGLYLDVSWGAPMLTDLSTSQNIFDLGEHAISLMEYSNAKLNILRHNIVSDKSMHYNSVIGQHRFNMENELFYVKVSHIDTHMLYVGITSHPLIVRTIEIIENIFNNEKTMHILQRYRSIILEQGKISAFTKYCGVVDPSRSELETLKFSGMLGNPGAFTNVYPISQAAYDLGLYVEDQYGEFYVDENYRNSINVNRTDQHFKLYRMSTESWLKGNASKQMFIDM